MVLLKAIRSQGLCKTIYQILTADEPRIGTFIAKDALGNEYYGIINYLIPQKTSRLKTTVEDG